MRLPWVSRLAFDLVVDERDRLRDQNDQLIRTYRGVTRARAGLRPEEQKAGPKEKRPEPLPEDLRALIGGFRSAVHREALEGRARAMHSDGTPYAEIRKILERQLHATDPETD